MWPLAAFGGWPLARGQLHSDSVNAQRMRPYMPGGRWRGGPYKRGTTVVQYPVRWTAQSAIHFFPSLADLLIPTPTRLLREAF